MAGPKTALCDTILYDSYLPSQSVKRLEQYLEEDVRIDMDALGELDISIIEACAQSGGKKNILNNLNKIIKKIWVYIMIWWPNYPIELYDCV